MLAFACVCFYFVLFFAWKRLFMQRKCASGSHLSPPPFPISIVGKCSFCGIGIRWGLEHFAIAWFYGSRVGLHVSRFGLRFCFMGIFM